ncbi:hypothetical protein NEDG_01475 [Nematocida displodere]|uniref:Uncharacterized protein n=1 Tax=Nematocida displodere TaxID=1805483 RepID=A0A177EDN8_9MICR|nr:hypothetical protein NEDG_01475 [Nematocida displodere]
MSQNSRISDAAGRLQTGNFAGSEPAHVIWKDYKGVLAPIVNDGVSEKAKKFYGELERDGFVPLVRDALLFIPEVIRNLIYVGHMELLYVVGIFHFLLMYRAYSKRISTHRLSILGPLIMDAGVIIPFVLVFIIEGAMDAGVRMSGEDYVMMSCLYSSLAIAIAVLPRILMSSLVGLAGLGGKVFWLIKLGMTKNGLISYGVGVGATAVMALGFAIVFYPGNMSYQFMVSESTIKAPYWNMYMDKCYSGLISLGIARCIFLLAERALLVAEISGSVVFEATFAVAHKQTQLLVITGYIFIVVGTISFLYTYYTVSEALSDTRIVKDIWYLYIGLCALVKSPAKLAKIIFGVLYTRLIDKAEGIFNSIRDWVSSNVITPISNWG